MQASGPIFQGVFGFGAAIIVLAIAAIFIFVGSQAYQTFTGIKGIFPGVSPLHFLFGRPWAPDDGEAGALIPIAGSFIVTILAVLLSTPLSVAVAIFITQIAPVWARRFMQPVLELFIGIPSIIYGLLGLQILVPVVAHVYNFFGGGFNTTGFAGYGALTAALVLMVMIMPTITTLSVDALRGLPDGLREASLALGATRWQAIRRTLVPAASTGIFTGVILGTGRAIGETLAVSFIVGGNSNSWPLRIDNISPYIHLLPTNVISVVLLFDFSDANNPSLTYSTVWTLAFVLLLISFILVAISRFIASRSVYNRRDQRPSPRQIARALAPAPGAELRSIAE